MVPVLAAAAFLIGSVPSGVLVARTQGVDLKKVGSGNIGATNVLRSMGKWPALATLVGDLLKGIVAVAMARYFDAGPLGEGITGLCSVLGHNFSIFLRFRGGKGVATSLGVLLIYSPQTALVTIIIWLMTVLITKYSSLGALVSFGLLPVSISVLDGTEKLPVAVLITLLLIVSHRENITRLARGTESKVGKRP